MEEIAALKETGQTDGQTDRSARHGDSPGPDLAAAAAAAAAAGVAKDARIAQLEERLVTLLSRADERERERGRSAGGAAPAGSFDHPAGSFDQPAAVADPRPPVDDDVLVTGQKKEARIKELEERLEAVQAEQQERSAKIAEVKDHPKP